MTKILIVDDEAKNSRTDYQICKTRGFETAEAADGMEAVELCERINMILLLWI